MAAALAASETAQGVRIKQVKIVPDTISGKNWNREKRCPRKKRAQRHLIRMKNVSDPMTLLKMGARGLESHPRKNLARQLSSECLILRLK
jgi:hypothetical protein